MSDYTPSRLSKTRAIDIELWDGAIAKRLCAALLIRALQLGRTILSSAEVYTYSF